MKLYKLFLGVTAAAMFAACSNDDIVAVGNGDNGVFDAEGNAFMKIGINLPTRPASRGIGDYGDDYGEFNDGEDYEYAVENAILVLFSGDSADENDLELVSAYQLGSGAWDVDNPANTITQITSSREFVQQITNAGASKKLYAYVILNKHNFFEVDNRQLTFNCGVDGHNHGVINGMTFGEFHKLELKESGRRYDANSFMMTNMPYANKPGGSENPAGAVVKYLYPVDVNSIYASKIDAENGAAATTVNVERVLAKVETAWAYPTTGTSLPGGGTADGNHFYTEDGYDYPVEILGWFIDNTNPNSYVTRNCEEPVAEPLGYLGYKNNGTYRMVSHAPVTPGAYRTFWAVDVNYDKKADGTEAPALINEGGTIVNTALMEYNSEGVNVGGRLRANNSFYYCTENTFDVAHQSEFNTTRVVVAADFGDPFYTIAQEAGVKYDNAGVVNYIKNRISERVSFMQWVADYCNSSVLNAVDFIDVEITDPADAGRTVIKIAEEPVGFTNAMVKGGKSHAEALAAYKRTVVGDATLTGHDEYLLNNYHVDLYKEGVAYYHALIKHFGDYETPWNVADHAGENNDVNGVYEGLDAVKYLGRYGVVRNNWYKIEIEGIRKIGSATVPVLPGTEPDTPDDQVENFLKVKINITPWAIRKQKVTL